MEQYFTDPKHLGKRESWFYLLLVSAEVIHEVELKKITRRVFKEKKK